MLSIRWHKILRDIWGSRLRTSLVVLSMAVGVFGVGMLASARANLSRTLNESYESIQPAHAEIYADPFDDDLVQTLRRIPGVAEAEGRAAAAARLLLSPGREYALTLTLIPDYADMRVNQVKWVSGELSPPLHEMWLERRTIEYIGVQQGDIVLVETASGKRRSMRIAGVGHDLTVGAAELTGLAAGFVTPATFEWLGLSREYTQLNIRVTGDTRDKQSIQAIADLVAAKIERSGRIVHSTFVRDPGSHPAEGLLSNVMLIMGSVSLLALVLSGFLVVNVVSAVLAQQVRQIGMMKAIGARDEQLMGMYMGMVAVFVALALVIAIPLGILGGNLFVMMLAPLFNVDAVPFGLSFPVLGLQLIVGLAVPMLAALYPILSGTRVTVYQALSNFGLSAGHSGGGLVDRVCALPSQWQVPRPWLMALRNTFRRKVRLVFTLTTLTVAGTAFVGVMGAHASLKRTFDVALEYWRYDVAVALNRPYWMDYIQGEAMRVPGVLAAESWGSATVRRWRDDGSTGHEMLLVTPPTDTVMIRPVLLEGRWLLTEDDNALVINTDVLRAEPDLKVGDSIQLKIGEKRTAWQVVGLVVGVMSGPMLYANDAYFTRLSGHVRRSSLVQVATAEHDAGYQAEIAKALEDQLTDAGIRVARTAIVADTRARVVQVLNVFVAILSIVAVLLAVVGALGLAGAMSLNILERTREIGIMRAVGASDKAIRQLVLAEGIFTGFLSWFFGSLLALPLGKILTDLAGQYLLRTRLEYAFSVEGAAVWLVIILLLSMISSLLPARAATHLTVSQALSYE